MLNAGFGSLYWRLALAGVSVSGAGVMFAVVVAVVDASVRPVMVTVLLTPIDESAKLATPPVSVTTSGEMTPPSERVLIVAAVVASNDLSNTVTVGVTVAAVMFALAVVLVDVSE